MRLLALLPLVLVSEARMGAADFDAASKGYTVWYEVFGQPAGAEQYLPGHRSRWMAPDGTCLEGRWYEQDGAICFVYEDDPAAHCWYVSRLPEGGLHAHYTDAPFETGFYEVGRNREPLACEGPDLGV